MDTTRLLTLKPKAPVSQESAPPQRLAMPMSESGYLNLMGVQTPIKSPQAHVKDEIADICAAMGIKDKPVGIVEVASAPAFDLTPDMVFTERDRQWMLETAGERTEPLIENDLPSLDGIEFEAKAECHFCGYIEEALSYKVDDEDLAFCFACIDRLTPILNDLYDVMEAMANER